MEDKSLIHKLATSSFVSLFKVLKWIVFAVYALGVTYFSILFCSSSSRIFSAEDPDKVYGLLLAALLIYLPFGIVKLIKIVITKSGHILKRYKERSAIEKEHPQTIIHWSSAVYRKNGPVSSHDLTIDKIVKLCDDDKKEYERETKDSRNRRQTAYLVISFLIIQYCFIKTLLYFNIDIAASSLLMIVFGSLLYWFMGKTFD